MFRRVPTGPQPAWKRPLYLALTALLGLIASAGVHAVLETWYLAQAPQRGWTVTWTNLIGWCALPIWVQVGLPIVGVVVGWLVGRTWWRWVYVEGGRWRRS